MIVAVCATISVVMTSNIASVARRQDCASIAHKEPLEAAIAVCREEFQREEDPKTGAKLAYLMAKRSDVEGAERIARSLLTTSARADALQVLGALAMMREAPDDAVIALEEARFLHRFLLETPALARDDSLLASARTNRSEFVDALQALDECSSLVQREDNKSKEWHCRTNAGRTLLTLGYYQAAQAALHTAQPLAVGDTQRADTEYQLASLNQERGDHFEAIVGLKRVLSQRERIGSTRQIIITEQNLAYSLAETLKFSEAKQHLERAKRLDVDRAHEPDRVWTAARVAYLEGDLPKAVELVQQYFEPRRDDDPDCREKSEASADRNIPIEVASMGAEIELARNELVSAEFWARCAVAEAERARSSQPTLELRPHVLKKRRLAYELRFTALARRGRVEDAAMVFDQWQGRTVQDALARPRLDASPGGLEIAAQVTRLDAWMRTVPAPFARPADRRAVLSTMRNVDLVAVIVANEEVWRLTATHGAPQLSRVGSRKELKSHVNELASHPEHEIQHATALGARLLPDEVFRKTSETLHVVIDDELTELPVAALRHGNVPLIGLRPFVRELRLPESPCVPMSRRGNATVLGDPRGTLKGAGEEADAVAELLHTRSRTGRDATKAALFGAANDAVLHVAAKTATGKDGTVIELADGEVSALEIAARALAPALVVLSDCSSAIASTDGVELIDSLVAGFLAAGSQHVVATLRSISDRHTLELMRRFYEAGGRFDPARALQAAQAELWKKAENTEWPLFTVFGPDVCLQDPPAHP